MSKKRKNDKNLPDSGDKTAPTSPAAASTPALKSSGSSLERTIWIIVCVILIGGGIYLYSLYTDTADRLSDAHIDLDQTRVLIDDAKTNADYLQGQVNNYRNIFNKKSENKRGIQHLLARETDALGKVSGKNPIDIMILDLIRQTELIPQKFHSSAKPRFIQSDIEVVAPHVVRAPFDYGTKQGFMLLEFEIDDNGAIVWMPLKTFDRY